MVQRAHSQWERKRHLFVLRKRRLIDAVFLFRVFKGRKHESSSPSTEFFKDLSPQCFVPARARGQQLTTSGFGPATNRVSDLAPPVGTHRKVDVQHHNKLGARKKPGDVSPYVELPSALRGAGLGFRGACEGREREMDVDVGGKVRRRRVEFFQVVDS